MEFPSNSRKVTENEPQSKQIEKEPVEKVVTGEVIKRKKPLGRRFKDIFLGAEFKDAKQYLTMEVLLPAMRNLIYDATTKGMERVVFGDTSPARRRPMGDPRAGRISYNSPVNRMGRQESVMMPRQPPHQVHRRQQDPGEIILASRQEAESVLEQLIDILDKYEIVSVADLYSTIGLPTTMIDNKWGWSVLHYVDIRQVREGWLLDLPSVEPI